MRSMTRQLPRIPSDGVTRLRIGGERNKKHPAWRSAGILRNYDFDVLFEETTHLSACRSTIVSPNELFKVARGTRPKGSLMARCFHESLTKSYSSHSSLPRIKVGSLFYPQFSLQSIASSTLGQGRADLGENVQRFSGLKVSLDCTKPSGSPLSPLLAASR